MPLEGITPSRFPQPVPNENEKDVHYVEGYDPTESHLPSKSQKIDNLPHNTQHTI